MDPHRKNNMNPTSRDKLLRIQSARKVTWDIMSGTLWQIFIVGVLVLFCFAFVCVCAAIIFIYSEEDLVIM